MSEELKLKVEKLKKILDYYDNANDKLEETIQVTFPKVIKLED